MVITFRCWAELWAVVNWFMFQTGNGMSGTALGRNHQFKTEEVYDLAFPEAFLQACKSSSNNEWIMNSVGCQQRAFRPSFLWTHRPCHQPGWMMVPHLRRQLRRVSTPRRRRGYANVRRWSLWSRTALLRDGTIIGSGWSRAGGRICQMKSQNNETRSRLRCLRKPLERRRRTRGRLAVTSPGFCTLADSLRGLMFFDLHICAGETGVNRSASPSSFRASHQLGFIKMFYSNSQPFFFFFYWP